MAATKELLETAPDMVAEQSASVPAQKMKLSMYQRQDQGEVTAENHIMLSMQTYPEFMAMNDSIISWTARENVNKNVYVYGKDIQGKSTPPIYFTKQAEITKENAIAYFKANAIQLRMGLVVDEKFGTVGATTTYWYITAKSDDVSELA